MENNNNNNNNQHPTQAPFWDFVQSFDPSGSRGTGFGVDHSNSGPQFPSGVSFDTAPFNPWGPWDVPRGGAWGAPWGRRGWHGPHGQRPHRGEHDTDNEEHQEEHDARESPETMRESDGPAERGSVPPPPPPLPGSSHVPPPPGPPHAPPPPHPHNHHGPPPPFGPHRRRGGRCGRGGRHGPPPPPYSGPFDFRPLMHAFATHPFAQSLRDYVDQTRAGLSGEQNEQQNEGFVPPVDVFNTDRAYVLHISLPGAAKEDIGVNWDGDKVHVAGVVYRPGNEDFNKCLASSERKVGMFERSIKLPPVGSGEKEDIDGLGITAKMDNGILIVTVPKAEKEWTEIHKVEIE